MSTLIQERASVLLGPRVTHSESSSEAEPGPLLTRGEGSTFQGLAWLTVGLGVVVTGLATAFTLLAIFQ